MNKAKNKLQQGFAVVELAIFIAVIVAVSGIGYYAINKIKATTSFEPTSSIASLVPAMGSAGDKIKVLAPSDKEYRGTYRVNIKGPGTDGTETHNVVGSIPIDGKSDLEFTFPEYACSFDVPSKVAKCQNDSTKRVRLNTTWSVQLERDIENEDGSLGVEKGEYKLYTITNNPSISNITSPVAIGQKITVKAGKNLFSNPPYKIYIHKSGVASPKIEIANGITTNTAKNTLEFKLTNDISEIINTKDTDWGMQVKDKLGQYSNSYGFTIVGNAPVITSVTLPKISENYQQGENFLPVKWAVKQTISAGQFCVKVERPTAKYVSKCTLVNANGGKSYSENIPLSEVPVGEAYKASVSWRPFHGGGAYGAPVFSTGSINIIAPPKPDKPHITGTLPVEGAELGYSAFKIVSDKELPLNTYRINIKPKDKWINSFTKAVRSNIDKKHLTFGIQEDLCGKYYCPPGINTWQVSITDSYNQTSNSTSIKVIVGIGAPTPSPDDRKPTPIPSPSQKPTITPVPNVTPTPYADKSWLCRYFKIGCPKITPTPTVTPAPTVSPAPTIKPTPKPWYCFRIFCK